jgi:hypothetical protein
MRLAQTAAALLLRSLPRADLPSPTDPAEAKVGRGGTTRLRACAELAQWGRPWCCYRAPFGTGVRGSAPHKKLSPSLRGEGGGRVYPVLIRLETNYPTNQSGIQLPACLPLRCCLKTQDNLGAVISHRHALGQPSRCYRPRPLGANWALARPLRPGHLRRYPHTHCTHRRYFPPSTPGLHLGP